MSLLCLCVCLHLPPLDQSSPNLPSTCLRSHHMRPQTNRQTDRHGHVNCLSRTWSGRSWPSWKKNWETQPFLSAVNCAGRKNFSRVKLAPQVAPTALEVESWGGICLSPSAWPLPRLLLMLERSECSCHWGTRAKMHHLPPLSVVLLGEIGWNFLWGIVQISVKLKFSKVYFFFRNTMHVKTNVHA